MKVIIRYKRSGNFGHSGRPGMVGGSGSGSLYNPENAHPPMSLPEQIGHMPMAYDRKTIGDILDRAKTNIMTTSGQMSSPKPGVDRDTLKRYYEQVNLYKLATSSKYAYQRPGETIADYIDQYRLKRGYSEWVWKKNMYRTIKPGMGEADGVNIRDKAGIAYLKLLDVLGED